MYPSLLSLPGDLLTEFESLQRQIDRALGPRGASSSIRAVERGSFPAVNIGSTPEAVEIYAFAPGIAPDRLELSVEKGLLTIAGERRIEQPEAGTKVSVYARERAEGGFRRVVALPDDADPDRVEASYRDGVLRIRVAKREASRPRRIEVRGAA
jgi:HSP20 family protein